MPARAKTPRSSVPTSTKPKRETKKPATYVPSIAPTIVKPKRVVAKPKSSVKVVKKSEPKSGLKKAAKNAPKKAAKIVRTKKSTTATNRRSSSKQASPSAKKPTIAKKGIKKTSNRKISKPKYSEMIIEGIKSIHKKSVSRQAIEKYIEEHFPKRIDAKTWIRRTLTRLLHEGKIQKVKASYKITPKRATKTKTSSTKKAVKAPKTKLPKAPRKTSKKAPAITTAPTISTAAESTGKPIWQYMHNGWQNYDAEASDLVEVQYQEWLNNNQMFDVRSVKSGNFEYNVDFRRMVQTNIQHPAHTEREIRRTIQ